MGRYSKRKMKYFAFPWIKIIRIGAAVTTIDDPQEINEAELRDGFGGSCRGEAAVNGMNELRLGNKRELGMRCSCCIIANIRKCRVM
jgi:hypothetical protein